MNKVMLGFAGVCGLVAATAASAAPWIAREAHVPVSNGMVAIALVKNGSAERTLVCRETADALVKIRPEGVAYDTSVKGGQKIVSEEIFDDAQVIPVAVNNCTLRQGNHFDAALNKARNT